jgi:uncharacterized protein YbbC (DUF1343 family)
LGARAQGRGEAGRDPRTGLPCVTLDGAAVQTVRQHLLPLDGLVVDLQDVGVRHYTYELLVWRVVEAAGQARRPVWVLDRPTPLPGPAQGAWPLGGDGRLGGPPVPLCHGLTLGELARLAAARMAVPTQLVVVPVQGWAGQPAYGRGGLAWQAPSPALRTPTDALRYCGLGLFEATNVACRLPGRAFAWFGAPWADGEAVARAAAAARLPGVAFRAEVHGGSGGVAIEVIDEARYLPIETGLAVLAAFARHHPRRFRVSARMMAVLSGSSEVSEMLQGDRDWRRLALAWRLAGRRFEAEAQAVRLYGRGRSPLGTFPPSGRSATLGTP